MVTRPDVPDATTSSEDDVQNINIDLDDLVNRFISPIEAYRSLSAPNLYMPSDSIVKQLNSAQINSNDPVESRAHTFYRMIGLPVISDSGIFYNPGFNSNLTQTDQLLQSSVARAMASATTNMQIAREKSISDRLAIFQKSGVPAAIYGAALGVFDGQRKLNVLAPDGNYKSEDQQKIGADKPRISYLNKYYLLRDGTSISTTDMPFIDGVHILRPLTTDPVIERTVRTVNGASGMICQPFLKGRTDTRIEPNRYLRRPGIEFVLRMRLRQRTMGDSSVLGTNISSLAQANLSQTETSDLRAVAQALLDKKVTDQDLISVLNSAKSIELITINTYIKTLKALVDMLIENFATIALVSSKITWSPSPNARGPEFGVQNGTDLRSSFGMAPIEVRLLTLEAKRQISTTLQTLSIDKNITPDQFALSEFQGVQKDYDTEIQKTEEEKKGYEDKGSNALRQIEILLGEISGLGLIDILAIWTALWAIDITALIALLDDSAFSRLYENNSDLRSTEVVARHNGTIMSVIDANKALEDIVSNILKFVDGLIASRVGDQKRKQTGSLAGS
jgi:hypothetical protein